MYPGLVGMVRHRDAGDVRCPDLAGVRHRQFPRPIRINLRPAIEPTCGSDWMSACAVIWRNGERPVVGVGGGNAAPGMGGVPANQPR